MYIEVVPPNDSGAAKLLGSWKVLAAPRWALLAWPLAPQWQPEQKVAIHPRTENLHFQWDIHILS